MTTITMRSSSAAATWSDRALLRAAASLDGIVVARLERRARRADARQVGSQERATQRRTDATAQGALGMLPR